MPRAPLAPLDGLPDPNGADCVACGRCCHHGPSTVQLLEEDETRLGEERLVRLTVLMDRPPFFRFLRNDGARCVGLEGSTEGHHPCAIYEVRPEGCRIVEPGSPCCLEARRLGHLGSSVEFRVDAAARVGAGDPAQGSASTTTR
ncbi:MAG: YkgJ family cysteine cluster protein [Deltaproteobacteria bacterium]|nr:YkgJ family cysteine cluster protein [Deltaproteobacteria bacterium]